MAEDIPLDKIELHGTVDGVDQRLIALNLGLTLYFPIPFRDQLAPVDQLLARYLARVPWSTFKFQNLSGTAKGYKRIASTAHTTISDWLTKKRDYGSACAIWLKDGQSIADAGNNLFNLFGRDRGSREHDSNYLRILFPHDLLNGVSVDEFLGWIIEMLGDLPYHSGHLGYTLGTSNLLQVSPYSTPMNERLYAVGKRFLGVEIERPHLENYDAAKYVRSPSWVTFLSKDALAAIGGLASLQKTLKGDFGYLATTRGVAIRAGALPQLGDRNRQGDALPEQRLLSKKLEPLYSPVPAILFANKEDEETLAWLRRLSRD